MPICINALIKNSYGPYFKLRNVYFFLSKLQLICYKRARVRHILSGIRA